MTSCVNEIFSCSLNSNQPEAYEQFAIHTSICTAWGRSGGLMLIRRLRRLLHTSPPITPPLGNILPHFGTFVKIECTIFLLVMPGIIGFDALLIFLLQ